MKFRRLFAAILSALMICSCFSFTASAQDTQTVSDPVKYFTAKSKSGVFIAKEGLTKTHTYDAVNDVIFYRQTSNGTGGSMHYDSYGLGQIPVTDGVIYFAMDYRSNLSTTPGVQVYGAKLYDGSSNNGGRFFAESATKGDGTWERIVIKYENSNLKEFNQNHILFLGDYTNSAFTGDKYFDVAAFGFFNDEYSAKNYDFGTAIEADGAATFSIDGEETDVVPESDPEVEGKIFIGWSSDDAATRGEELTALSTVPTAEGATYYALFTGTVEDEKAVYISANGDDTNNSGRHSRTPVATFEKALALMGDGIDTIYVVGQYTLPGNINLGVSGKPINVYGYNGTADSIAVVDKHVNFVGDVVIDNISLSRTSNDGGYQLQGHNVTIGTNVKTSGSSNFISQDYYGSDITDADGSVLTIKSGTWNRVMTGTFTDKTYTGNPTHNIGGTAVIKRIGGGHGSGSIQTVKGTYTLNVTDSAVIDLVDFTCSGGNNPTNKHYGARFINVNGGTVTAIKTTSSVDREVNAGVTVITVNDGTVGSIAQNLADTTNKRVVIFNDGVEAITVADDNAIVIDVTGGALEADVTVAEDYTATLDGFTYELDVNYYNAVKIGSETIMLENLAEEGVLPVSHFKTGVNTVEFLEVDSAPFTSVYVSDSGDDANKGDSVKAPVKTLKRVNELLRAEGSVVENVYIVGTVTATAADKSASNHDGFALGTAGREITYLGYTDDDEADVLDAHAISAYLAGDVVMDDFFFQIQTTWDGRFLAEGNDITIGEGMQFGGYTTNPNPYVIGGTSVKLGNYYYRMYGGSKSGVVPTFPWNNTYTIKAGNFASIYMGVVSGEKNFTGRTVLDASGTAKISTVSFTGHGSGNILNNTAHFTVKVSEGAEITTISTANTSTGNAIGGYKGLREVIVDGGRVGKITTTAAEKSTDDKQTAGFREGIMYIEVNGGTVGEISKPANDENEKTTAVVIFNDGVTPVTYTDSEAYVLNVNGGNVKADITVADDYTTATLNKFKFTTSFDGVRITAGDKSAEYDVAELNGEISLDKLTVGTANEVEFFLKDEPAHIAAYRADGYEIVYVAAAGAGTKDGSTPVNAYGGLVAATGAKSGENKKVVFALVDDFTLTAGAALNVAGGEVVITSAGGAINLGKSSLALASSDKNADVIFDNIKITKGSGERAFNARGNNVTLTSTVTIETPEKDPFYINANDDGATTTNGNTVTVNAPGLIQVRASGWSGNNTQGNVNYVIGESATVGYLIAAGKVGHATAAANFVGDATVTVKDRATLTSLVISEGRSTLTGNLYVNVQDAATVGTININNTVTGNALIKVNGGSVTKITASDVVTGIASAIIDTDKATVTEITGLDYAIKYNASLGTVTPSADYATINVAPAEGVKYVRITNGTDVKEYNVAGEEVELMADLSAIALAAGTTTVEFLTEGTEKPENVTLKFFANLAEEEAEAWLTKTVEYGATNDVFPIQSDKGRETAGSNDIFAYPDNANGHFLGWSTDKTADNIVVRETYTATADEEFYAIWEALDLLTTEEITVTNVVTADDFVVPDGAEKFEHKKVEGAFTGITTIFNADGTEYKAIGTGEKYPGLGGANTTINSYVGSLGSETATVLFPAGSAMYPIWMKFNDGKVIGAKTALEGEVNVAFVFNASPSDATARGFYISAGDVAGTYNMTPANKVEGGSTEFVVTLKTTVEAGDLIAYAAPYNFDNNTVKAAQLEAIYVWKDAPVVTTANAIFDANGGAWADDATTKTVETTIGETPVAPTEAPEKAGFTFKGWTPALTAMTAEGATYKAVWEENVVVTSNKIYLSDAGDDGNDGLTAETPVKHMTKVNAMLAANADKDTVVIVGTYSIAKDKEQKYGQGDDFGIAGRTITITGNTADAHLVLDRAYNAWDDAYVSLAGPIVLSNLKIEGDHNDGTLRPNGHKVVVEDTVAAYVNASNNFYYEKVNTAGSEMTVGGGAFTFYAGQASGDVSGKNPKITINGGSHTVEIAKGNYGTPRYSGKYDVTVNGGTVTISLQSSGTGAANAYQGLRYYTINGGTVKKIIATGSSQYLNNKTELAPVAVPYRRGTTVFEINKAGVLEGNISLGTNKKVATQFDADDATRIILFNNGSYEEGKVLDTGAITANVIGGAIKADVTMAADFATTLNGYTFTAADEAYDRVTITPATGEEKTYVLSEITAIPAADLVAGTNKVVFFKYVEEAAEVDVVFDANGGAWADGETTKVVKTLESEIPVAPAEAPAQAGYTFKGWTPEFAPVTAEGATYKAVWEKIYTKIYISNSGKNSNDGLTPETAVRSLATANTLLARDGIDTLVVVGTFTSEKDADTLGVADKHITVTGQDANALFEIETYLKNNNGGNIDDDLVLAGPVTFKNIKIKDGSGDGVIQARGNKVVFDEGVAYGGDSIEVAGWSGNNDITIKSGSFGRVLPGAVSGSFSGNTKIHITGGTGMNIVLGHGWRGNPTFYGNLDVTVDGGSVKQISLNSGGVDSAVAYKGVRYFTLNGGTVEAIYTTESSQWKDNSNPQQVKSNPNRTGVTVFEINKADIVTGNISLGTNVVSGKPEADNSTRVIIYNNNSYKAGQVTDTGAITVEVRNGAIKADVTMAADYTTTLNGYTFTTDKAKVNINGTNYNVADLNGKIPADKLAEGYNLVIFTDADLAPVKWVVGETETQDYAEVGGKLTAPAVTVPAPTKDNYYTFDGWKIGEEPVDFETYTVPAEGATLTAVLTAHEMPASATFDFTGVAAPNNQPIFTGEAVTYKGVEAVKVTPGADVTETSINIEGWEKWPLNKSYPANEKFVNTAIYPYVAVRYFYVPGTAEDLTTGFWINSNNTFEGNNGTTITVDGGAAEAGKWTYVVYDLSATNMANKVSRQYWVQGLKGMTLGDMNKAGVEYYIDTLTIYKDAPTVATITFNAEDGTTLYAIDAINGEAVAFYGDAPTKDNHTFLGWAIEGTTDVVDSFAFTADTALVPVFEENEPVFPTTAQYKTYGIYDELAGTYTVELKIAGGVFNQGAFGFNFPTEQMTFVSAAANEEAGIKFLTGTPVTETDKAGYYAAAWYATEDIDGKADASAAELTLVTFEFTMTPEQRAAFVAANATLTEYVNAQPDDAEAFAKYHNGTNYLVAPHDTTPSIERQAVVYKGHVDEVEENAVEYRTYGTYDAAKGTYSIDVKVIGGKFNLGAFGLAFDSQYMTYDPEDESALVLAEDIANYLGVTLANTAEGVAFVWDGSKIEGAGYVDATDGEVLIATIKTTMTPEQREAFVLAQMPMSVLAIDNADYFANGNYLVRPYTNGLDTPKVEAVYASHSDDEAEITTAAVTVKVTFAGKTGATAANIGYISVDGAEAVAIDAAGNTEATVEYVIADVAIGDEIELEIFKNGYIGATVTYTVQATANVIEITTIPGDIKGTADALCGDGKVSLDDFVRIIRAFDSAASDDYKASVDLDESGAVNVTDIGLIKTNFGKTTDDVTVVINGQAQ